MMMSYKFFVVGVWVCSLVGAMTMTAAGVEVIAHRGFSMRAPENTVAALNLAWEHKADACEIDIRLSSDGQMVLMHDVDTKKTGGEPGLVVEDTAAVELFKLDVGLWKGEQWKGEKVPTLTQALASMPVGHQRMFIEVKSGVEIVPSLSKELESNKVREKQLVVMCFQHEVVAAVKKATPWVKVFRLSSTKDKQKQPVDLGQLIELVKKDGLDGLSLSRDWPWSEEMVKQVRDAGLELYAWTINDAVQAELLGGLKVDGIITDDPVMVREVLKK